VWRLPSVTVGRTPVRPTVKLVEPIEVRAMADLLVRSFDDDPVAGFMFPGDRRRRLGLHSFFTTQIRRQYMPYGHVYTTEDHGGVAVWGPPDRPVAHVRELLQLLPTAPFLVSTQMIHALKLLADIDAAHPKEPHWYLATLGADPARQGTGIGSALLGITLAKADEDGMPAYLESSKERNIPLYARFGFEVIGEINAPRGGPMLWRMWREPRPPDG
jgi:GNAT superfamily N-acetyltransferase